MEEFSITDFFKYYIRKIKLLVIFLCVGLFCVFIYSSYIQIPLYKSETSILIIQSNNIQSITQNDLILIKNLAPTYSEYLKSRKVLSQIIQNLKLNISVKDLSKRINVINLTDTAMISISVIDENSDTAAKITNELASVFIRELANNFNTKNVNIVDKAIASSKPININYKKQYILGISVSFLIGSFIILILFYFDNSIKTSEDIEKNLGLTVLFSISQKKRVSKNKLIKNSGNLNENIHTLYSNLQVLLIHKKIKTILITSSTEENNNNFIASDFATLLANNGLKVLLIEKENSDDKKRHLPTDSKFEVYQKYIKKTEFHNLFTMPNIFFDENQSLLDMEITKGEKLISILKTQYDFVIFDSLSIEFTNSLLISTLVDGVIITATQNITPVSSLKTAKDNLENLNANILGVIIDKK